MATTEKGRSLPKFGEWDVNNPASAEGFTVIFAKARDNKQTNNPQVPTNANQNQPKQDSAQTTPKNRRCCF